MRRFVKGGFALAVAVTIIGCASVPTQPYAREVKKHPRHGGEIALREDYGGEDRAKADILMVANCGGSPVRVLEESQVVVLGGNLDPETSFSESEQRKEWRINYACTPAESEPVVRRSTN